MGNDPLAGLKLIAGTYGIPAEMTEALVHNVLTALSDGANFVRSSAAASQAAEIASLAVAAKSLAEIGQSDISFKLIARIEALVNEAGDLDGVDPAEA